MSDFMPDRIVVVRCASERFWMEPPVVAIGSSVSDEAEYRRDDAADPLVRLSEVEAAFRAWWDEVPPCPHEEAVRLFLARLAPTPRHGIDAGKTFVNEPITDHDAGDEHP